VVAVAVSGSMLAASSMGIFLVPMVYVIFQRWSDGARRRFGKSEACIRRRGELTSY
jgi:hypothetical protein